MPLRSGVCSRGKEGRGWKGERDEGREQERMEGERREQRGKALTFLLSCQPLFEPSFLSSWGWQQLGEVITEMGESLVHSQTHIPGTQAFLEGVGMDLGEQWCGDGDSFIC